MYHNYVIGTAIAEHRQTEMNVEQHVGWELIRDEIPFDKDEEWDERRFYWIY